MEESMLQERRSFLHRSVLGLVGACMAVLWFGPLACGASPGETSAAGDEVSVMSFNIRYGTAGDGDNRWEKRRDLVYKVIDEHDCDVVGLQEALRFQIDEIRDVLPDYGEIGVGRNDGKTRGEYTAILYREDRLDVNEFGTFWLSDTPEVPGSTSWGNSITRICTWGRFTRRDSRRSFYVFNVHLDHRSQPSREKSVVLLARRIAERKHRDPVIVTGDFNAGEDNPAVLYLKGKVEFEGELPGPARTSVPLVDTFRELHPDATDVGTFNGFKGDRSGAKIDYVFVQPDVRVLDARILHDSKDGRYPSDHFPVTTRLRLPASGVAHVAVRCSLSSVHSVGDLLP
jgi:endonuclease/exonuclease/phosphatase family metal-dependent hydrolase